MFLVTVAEPTILQRATEGGGAIQLEPLCGGDKQPAPGVAFAELAACADAVVGVNGDLALSTGDALWLARGGGALELMYAVRPSLVAANTAVPSPNGSVPFGAVPSGVLFPAEGRINGVARVRDDSAVERFTVPGPAFTSDRRGGLYVFTETGTLEHRSSDGTTRVLLTGAEDPVLEGLVDLAPLGERVIAASASRVVVVGASGGVDVVVAGAGAALPSGSVPPSIAVGVVAVAGLDDVVWIIDGRSSNDDARLLAVPLSSGASSDCTPPLFGPNDIVAADDEVFLSLGFQGLHVCRVPGCCTRVSGLASEFDGHPLAESVVVPTALDVDGQGRLVMLDSSSDRGEFEARVRRVEDGIVRSIAGGQRDPATIGPAAIARFVESRGLAVVDGAPFSVTGRAGRVLWLRDGIVDVASGHPGDFAFSSPDAVLPARWAPLFRDAAGLAFDPDTRRLFVSDALAGQISVIQLDVDGDGIDDTPLAWVRHQLAVVHELVSPRGLSVDHVDGKVLVADAGAHCVLSVDPTSGDADVVLGACGVFGRDNDTAAQERSLLFAPAAAVRSPSGALYVSDAGNRRVRRAEAGIVTTVIGEGSASTAGEGRPARTFPIEDPGQLVVDAHGNLFIAAGSAVRLVANIDGDADADGDDLALTPFAGRGNDTFPDRLFRCVTGLADTGDGVIVSDSCTGLVVNVR